MGAIEIPNFTGAAARSIGNFLKRNNCKDCGMQESEELLEEEKAIINSHVKRCISSIDLYWGLLDSNDQTTMIEKKLGSIALSIFRKIYKYPNTKKIEKSAVRGKKTLIPLDFGMKIHLETFVKENKEKKYLGWYGIDSIEGGFRLFIKLQNKELYSVDYLPNDGEDS